MQINVRNIQGMDLGYKIINNIGEGGFGLVARAK